MMITVLKWFGIIFILILIKKLINYVLDKNNIDKDMAWKEFFGKFK